MHRRKAEEIRLDGQRIGIRHIGIGVIRHGRIKARTVWHHTPVQHPQEILIGEVTYPGLAVRCDIRRI
ncbi:MAG: hypothetical protein ACREPS_10465, partial [Rhodanobacteraceae bacterium]